MIPDYHLSRLGFREFRHCDERPLEIRALLRGWFSAPDQKAEVIAEAPIRIALEDLEIRKLRPDLFPRFLRGRLGNAVFMLGWNLEVYLGAPERAPHTSWRREHQALRPLWIELHRITETLSDGQLDLLQAALDSLDSMSLSGCSTLPASEGELPMSDGTTKHAGWMPSNLSMSQGSRLAPDWENLGGSADDSTTLAAGDTPKGATSSMSESSGGLTTRIMEDGIDYTMPSSGQGNLEPQGPGVKGAG